MPFDIYGEQLTPGHCEVHPYISEPYPCSVCMEQEREPVRTYPESPPCDICGEAPAVAGQNGLGVCSQECYQEAIRRTSETAEEESDE